MNLLVTLNDNYILPLKIMLASFFEHNGKGHKIYFLYSDVKEEKMQEVNALIRENGCELYPIRMDNVITEQIPVFRYFTMEMYYRLFAGRVLPAGEKRVLYLDPDILIRGNLQTMYETDLEGMVMAGIEDNAVKTLLSAHKQKIGFREEECYINSGVLLMDLDKMQEKFDPGEMYRILEENREVLEYPDQDVINLLFRGQIKVLERRYNYNTGYGSAIEMIKYLLYGFYKEKRYAVIVHFMGASKPWHPDYFGKFLTEYRRYLKKYPSGEKEKGRIAAVTKHFGEIIIRKIGEKRNGKK